MTSENTPTKHRENEEEGSGALPVDQDTPALWMTRAIEAILVLLTVVALIAIYHFAVVERTAQRFALLDISEVIGIKQLVIADMAIRPGTTDMDREQIYDSVASFAKDIEAAVAQIQLECACTLLVRSAVVKTTAAEDLTPLLKARLGLDKSIADLTASIRNHPGSSPSTQAPSTALPLSPRPEIKPGRLPGSNDSEPVKQ